jgi:hypothetical protein
VLFALIFFFFGYRWYQLVFLFLYGFHSGNYKRHCTFYVFWAICKCGFLDACNSEPLNSRVESMPSLSLWYGPCCQIHSRKLIAKSQLQVAIPYPSPTTPILTLLMTTYILSDYEIFLISVFVAAILQRQRGSLRLYHPQASSLWYRASPSWCSRKCWHSILMVHPNIGEYMSP